MGDANTQRNERQIRSLVQRASNSRDCPDQPSSLKCCLCVAAFSKQFPIARSRHVTRCAVTNASTCTWRFAMKSLQISLFRALWFLCWHVTYFLPIWTSTFTKSILCFTKIYFFHETGSDTEIRECNTGYACWSDWSSWTECSKTCGIGRRFRWRTCNVTSLANCSLNCAGDEEQSENCNTGNCRKQIFVENV